MYHALKTKLFKYTWRSNINRLTYVKKIDLMYNNLPKEKTNTDAVIGEYYLIF